MSADADTAAAAARRVLAATVVDAAVGRRALILLAALRALPVRGTERDGLVIRVRDLRRDKKRAIRVLQNLRETVAAL